MFKVGDFAVVTGSEYAPQYIGTICEIIEPYEVRELLKPDGSTHMAGRYIVRMHDGCEGGMSFRNLRHINPPDETTTWSECVWSPDRTPARTGADQ